MLGVLRGVHFLHANNVMHRGKREGVVDGWCGCAHHTGEVG